MEIDDHLLGAAAPALRRVLVDEALPSLRLTVAAECAPGTAATRLGGVPLLTPGSAWPHSPSGNAQSFLGQLNSDDVNRHLGSELLPPGTVLGFFYDWTEQRWGFDPADAGHWQIVPTPLNEAVPMANPAASPAGRGEPVASPGGRGEPVGAARSPGGRGVPVASPAGLGEPVGAGGRGGPMVDPVSPGGWSVPLTDAAEPVDSFTAHAVSTAVVLTVPGIEELPAAAARGDRHWWQRRDPVEDFYDALENDEDVPLHRVFGWPDLVQGPMRLECQLAANGVHHGNPAGVEGPRVQELSPGAADWLLLWQIDTDDTMDWVWGDAGRLYYWIRRRDLAARDFTRPWVVLQCS